MIQNCTIPGLNHSVTGQNRWKDYLRLFQTQVGIFVQSYVKRFQRSAIFS